MFGILSAIFGGVSGPADESTGGDEQLARISAGEHPWSVLGSALDRGLPRDALLGLPAASEEDGEAEEPD